MATIERNLVRGLTLADLQVLVPHFTAIKDRLELVKDSTDTNMLDDNCSESSCCSSDDDQVFDSAPNSVQPYTAIAPVAHIATVPANGQLYTLRDLGNVVMSMAKLLTPTELKDMFRNAGYVVPQAVFDFYHNLTMLPCTQTGVQHRYMEHQRCVTCDKQLCLDCQQSILPYWRLFASPEHTRSEGLFRESTLGVSRIASTCASNTCAPLSPRLDHACRCLEALARISHPDQQEVEGYHHCLDCAVEVNLNLGVPNVAYMGCRGGEEGPEELVVYACACGKAANVWESPTCKLCLGETSFCVLNDYDQVTGPDGSTRIVMRSWNNHKIHGGMEGQAGWEISDQPLHYRYE